MPYHAVDRGGMIIKCVYTSARATVPQSHSLVITTAYNQRAVGAEKSKYESGSRNDRFGWSPHGRTAHPVRVTMQSVTEFLLLKT